MSEQKTDDQTGTRPNVHATNGYAAGEAKAREHSYPLWVGKNLQDQANSAAQTYRWSYSTATDVALSGADWHAYRDGFIKGYERTIAELKRQNQPADHDTDEPYEESLPPVGLEE